MVDVGRDDGAPARDLVAHKFRRHEIWYCRAEGLAIAEREGKPVLVDMWATWCKNCLVMDATTLKNPDVIGALSGYVKVKFQAEDPDDQNVAQVMQALNAKGLPTYVILKRR